MDGGVLVGIDIPTVIRDCWAKSEKVGNGLLGRWEETSEIWFCICIAS
jgi:hypothetical protein